MRRANRHANIFRFIEDLTVLNDGGKFEIPSARIGI